MTFKDEIKKKIVGACKAYGIVNKLEIEYVLATVDHETNGTFIPVQEAYWLSEGWRKRHLRYYPYYGRGYSQITWKNNYERFGKLLDIDLVSNPDLALEPDVAMSILILGMRDGLFTGKKLSDFSHQHGFDFIHARKIINGMDKALHIAGLAHEYENVA